MRTFDEIRNLDQLTLALEVLRLQEENERLRDTNTELSWKLNPDRMGGQFTEEEKSRDGWL